jgi:hypothetical protein
VGEEEMKIKEEGNKRRKGEGTKWTGNPIPGTGKREWIDKDVGEYDRKRKEKRTELPGTRERAVGNVVIGISEANIMRFDCRNGGTDERQAGCKCLGGCISFMITLFGRIGHARLKSGGSDR